MNIGKSKKEINERDMELVKKIKPKLRKFVIDEQTKSAVFANQEQRKEALEILSRTDVLNRASQLAVKGLLGNKLWIKQPPTLEMKWTKEGTTSKEYIEEMNADIAGFASYLAREYITNYLKLGNTKRGYLNPLEDKNLEFFWRKFNIDLIILLEAASKYSKKNKQEIIIKKP